MSKYERRKTKARGDEGFTLIELMVVISILGILAGLAIPRFHVYRAEAKKIDAVAFGRQVLNSLTVHAANDPLGEYPVVATHEELEMALAEVGTSLTEKQRESYFPANLASASVIMVCECERKNPGPFDDRYFSVPCAGPVHPECKRRTGTMYILELAEAPESRLMISTDGTTQVITEDQIPAVGLVE